jgi:hypothetical protein
MRSLRALSSALQGSCLIALLAGAGFAQTTWYVDASAAPGGNGTAASPYADIAEAIQAATTVTGDTLLVAPGTYDGYIGTGLKGLSVVSSAGPEVTVLDGSPYLFGPEFGPVFRVEGFTILVGSLPMRMDVAALERCVVRPKNPPGSIAIIAGAAYGGSSTFLTRCTVAGFYLGVQEAAISSCDLYLESSVLANLDKDVRGENTYVTAFYSYVGELDVLSAVIQHPVPGSSPGLWDAAAGDFHLLPLAACVDAGDPALPPDPDGSRADAGALPFDAQHVPHPSAYAAGLVHSGGCAPRIDWSGTPSLSGPDDFVIRSGSSLNNVLGLFLVGTAAKATPFAGGNLFVAPPFVRGPVMSSGGNAGGPDCSGEFVWHVSHAYMQAQGWLPGQVRYAQAWGRDPGSAHPAKSQLSNGLVFQVEP